MRMAAYDDLKEALIIIASEMTSEWLLLYYCTVCEHYKGCLLSTPDIEYNSRPSPDVLYNESQL